MGYQPSKKTLLVSLGWEGAADDWTYDKLTTILNIQPLQEAATRGDEYFYIVAEYKNGENQVNKSSFYNQGEQRIHGFVHQQVTNFIAGYVEQVE